MLYSVVLRGLVRRPQSKIKELLDPVVNTQVSKNGESAVSFLFVPPETSKLAGVSSQG